MASPTDSARQATNISTAATSHAINVGSPVGGTLLIVFVRFAAAPGTVTFVAANGNPYGLLVTDSSDATDDTTNIYWRWADGAEGATDTLTTGNSVKLGAISWEVTGAMQEAPQISAVSVGTTAANTAQSNSVAPAGAPKDTLYISMAGGDGEVGAYTAFPTNYANLIAANSGTGGLPATNVLMGGASRQISASASDDAGVFTHGAHTTGWTAYAVAIREPQAQIIPEVNIPLGQGAAVEVAIKAMTQRTIRSPVSRSLIIAPLPVGSSGATYEKTGALIAGAVLAGADVFTAAETGALTPDTTLAGADASTFNRLGALTPDTSLSGADVFEAVETGSLTPDTTLSGVDVFTAAELGALIAGAVLAGTSEKTVGGITYNKAGALIAAAMLSGLDAFTAAETGSLTPDTTVVGADVFEAAETGSLTPDTTLSGLDSFQPAEAGSLTPDTTLSGLDAFTAAETGTLMALAVLSGVGTKVGSYIKAGSLIGGTLLAGADASTFNRLGALVVDTTLSGERIRDIAKLGALLSAAQLRGADVFTAAETGTLTSGASLAGGRIIIANRTGALYTATVLSGPKTVVPGLTILTVIITGQIGHGFSGRMDEGEHSGEIDSGGHGHIEKADRGFVGASVGGEIPE